MDQVPLTPDTNFTGLHRKSFFCVVFCTRLESCANVGAVKSELISAFSVSGVLMRDQGNRKVFRQCIYEVRIKDGGHCMDIVLRWLDNLEKVLEGAKKIVLYRVDAEKFVLVFFHYFRVG